MAISGEPGFEPWLSSCRAGAPEHRAASSAFRPQARAGVAQGSLGSGEVGVAAEAQGGKDSHCDSHSPSPPPLNSDVIRTLTFNMWTVGLVGKARVLGEVGWVIGGGLKRWEDTVTHVMVTEHQG